MAVRLWHTITVTCGAVALLHPVGQCCPLPLRVQVGDPVTCDTCRMLSPASSLTPCTPQGYPKTEGAGEEGQGRGMELLGRGPR